MKHSIDSIPFYSRFLDSFGIRGQEYNDYVSYIGYFPPFNSLIKVNGVIILTPRFYNIPISA
jgi:hypothetical protein